MKNQILSDSYIAKKIRSFNERHGTSVEHLGVNPLDLEELWSLYNPRGLIHMNRETNHIYGCEVYTNENILRGTVYLYTIGRNGITLT